MLIRSAYSPPVSVDDWPYRIVVLALIARTTAFTKRANSHASGGSDSSLSEEVS